LPFMSFINVYIHFVWSTKLRKPSLVKPYRQLLFDHMKQNGRDKGIHIDRVNGYVDHVHCLVSLKPGQSIDNIARLIKGESTHWFNHISGIQNTPLQWQSEYFAISVSPSILKNVRSYIDRQEQHHSKTGYEKEYQELVNLFPQSDDINHSPFTY